MLSQAPQRPDGLPLYIYLYSPPPLLVLHVLPEDQYRTFYSDFSTVCLLCLSCCLLLV